MIDEKRLRLMIRLARYEQEEGREDLKISKYYRRDYVGLALLKNLLLVTLAYLLLLALLVLYNLDFLMNQLNEMSIRPLLVTIALGYLFLLGMYSVIVYTISRLKYARAQASIKTYYRGLSRLEGSYQKQDADLTQEAASLGRKRQDQPVLRQADVQETDTRREDKADSADGKRV